MEQQNSLFDYDGANIQPVKPMINFKIEDCELISIPQKCKIKLDKEEIKEETNDPFGYSSHSVVA